MKNNKTKNQEVKEVKSIYSYKVASKLLNHFTTKQGKQKIAKDSIEILFNQ